MTKTLIGLLGVVAVCGAVVSAQQKPGVQSGVIKWTDATSPQQMFNTYCAVCHGVSGKGDGPAAVALKKAPADLTTITARNAGQFPTVAVSRYIRGADEYPAHGSRDMPIWGNLFRAVDGNSPESAMVRVNGLVEYIKAMQK